MKDVNNYFILLLIIKELSILSDSNYLADSIAIFTS
jgi:hypothetical protein